MAKNNNLGDFLTGIADKIRIKRGYSSSTLVPAQNFEQEIMAISDNYFGQLVFDGNVQVDSGVSVVPPPYDQDGYNYDNDPPQMTSSETISISEDLTDYDELKIIWNDARSSNGYGTIRSSVTIGSASGSLYSLGDPNPSSGVSDLNGDIITTIDISNITGTQNVVISNYAHSSSPYRYWGSRAVTNVFKIFLN